MRTFIQIGIVIAVLAVTEAQAVQFARPASTISAGSWTASGAPTLHEAVLTSNDNTDYIVTTTNTTAELGLSGVTDPGVTTGHIIRFRFTTSGSGAPERCDLQLYQGASLIASTGIQASRGVYGTFEYTLTTVEAGNIAAGYADLRFRIVSSSVGGGEEVRVTWAEFEVPDAAGATAPTVANPSIASVEDTTATLGGEITDTGGENATERGIYWSTTPGFTPPGQGIKVWETGSFIAEPFTVAAGSLDQSALIYFRAFATNSGGNGFSAESSFQTEPTTQASGITFSGIGTDTLTVNWSTSGDPNVDGSVLVMREGAAVPAGSLPTDGTEHGDGAGVFGSGNDLGSLSYVVFRGTGNSAVVTGLTASTTYWVKVFTYAGSGTGVTGINYQQDAPPESSQDTAGAGPLPPTVVNPSIVAVEDVTATLGGEVTVIESPPVTQRGVYWSTTPGFTPPGQGTKVFETGTFIAEPFSVGALGLNESSLIYFKAFALDGVGEGFSSEASFQTEPTTPASSIVFSGIGANGMTVSWTAGSGDGALVVMKAVSSVTALPTDGDEHAASSSFGVGGADLGTEEYVVYRGPANSVTVGGLTPETDYYVKVFEYAGSGTGVTGINYQQDGAPEAFDTTTASSVSPSHNQLRNIQCDQCHALHDTVLPREAAQESVCKACHNETQMGAGNPHLWDINMHVVNGGATTIDCGSCHVVHAYDFNTDNTSHGGVVAENTARIRWDTAKYVPGALEPAIFQQRPGHFAFGETAYPTGPWNGICQTCHQNTKNHTNDGWDADSDPLVQANNNHEIGNNCTGCHTHSDGFLPQGCTGCHNQNQDKGDGPPTRRAVVGEFALTAHHVGGTPTDGDCKVCHYEAVDGAFHQNNVVDLRDPDTGNRIGMPSTGNGFTKFTRDRSSDTLEEWVTTIQNEMCMKCHDIDGALATANTDEGGTALQPFSSNTRDVPAVFERFDPANNFHHAVRAPAANDYCVPSTANGSNITMEPPWNQDSTGGPLSDGHDMITCFDCHADVVTDPDGTANLVSIHGGNNQRMLRTAVDLDEIEAAWVQNDHQLMTLANGASVANFCTTCHKQSVYIFNNNDPIGAGSRFPRHGDAQGQHTAQTSLNGQNTMGCMGCHAGIVNFGVVTTDNGARRGNVHGDNFPWPTDSFANGTTTSIFLLGGWLGGWQIVDGGVGGECSGGECNHTGSSTRNGQSYSR